MELQIFIHVINVIKYILYNARNDSLIDWIIKVTLQEQHINHINVDQHLSIP